MSVVRFIPCRKQMSLTFQLKKHSEVQLWVLDFCTLWTGILLLLIWLHHVHSHMRLVVPGIMACRVVMILESFVHKIGLQVHNMRLLKWESTYVVCYCFTGTELIVIKPQDFQLTYFTSVSLVLLLIALIISLIRKYLVYLFTFICICGESIIQCINI